MEFPRIIVSSDRSDSGKTLISSAIMRILSKRFKVRGFKVGPDYIDPKYHKLATSVPSINLDLWLMGKEGVLRSLVKYGKGFDIGVIEGVMGLYDGINVEYSTYELSEITKTPIILVINCNNVSSTVGSIVKGLREYKNANILGVIFNQVGSESHLNYCKSSVKGVEVLGFLKYDKRLNIPSRHLGLFTTEDYKEAEEVIKIAAEELERTIDIDKLLNVANMAGNLPNNVENELPSSTTPSNNKKVAAIAYDSAFNFYYEENIDLLKQHYEIRFFSPLMNERVENPDLIYLGGGYPELHLNELEKASETKSWIKREAEKGTRIFGECGGLMFLSNEIINERSYKMVGLFNVSIKAKDKLTIGYTELEAIEDNILGRNGSILRGHEFHVSKAVSVAKDVRFALRNKIGKGIWEGKDGVYTYNSLGTYSHFHFSSTRSILSF